MVNTYLGKHTYFSYLRLISSDSLAWLKSGNHAHIKQAQYIMHSACTFYNNSNNYNNNNNDLFQQFSKIFEVQKKYSILLNQLCMITLFTKGERSLIFSSLKKSSYLKSMLLLNFPIRWSSNWNEKIKNNNSMIFE